MLPLNQRDWRENGPRQGLRGKQENVLKGEKKHAGTSGDAEAGGAAFVSTLSSGAHLAPGAPALWRCRSKDNVWGGKGGGITGHTLLQIRHNYYKGT